MNHPNPFSYGRTNAFISEEIKPNLLRAWRAKGLLKHNLSHLLIVECLSVQVLKHCSASKKKKKRLVIAGM